MSNEREARYEDTKYPTVKIYGLSSILVHVTTDYALPLLTMLGLTAAHIDVISAIVRPAIEVYQGDFYGIVPEDLLRLQRRILESLREAKQDGEHVFHLLQRFSVGRRRFLWVPGLAWADLGWYTMKTPDHKATHVAPATYAAFRDMYRTIVDEPERRLSDCDSIMEAAWDRGERSSWDAKVDAFIFAPIGIIPNILSPAGNMFIRDLAERVVSSFDRETQAQLHEEFLAILSKPSMDRLGYKSERIPSFAEIAERSADEWSALRADIRTGFHRVRKGSTRRA